MEIDEFRKKWTEAQKNGLQVVMVSFPIGSERMSAEKVKAKICECAALRGEAKKHVFYSANSVVKKASDNGSVEKGQNFRVRRNLEKIS